MFLPALVKAQYCGNSGPAVCTPVSFTVDTNVWSNISMDSFPCVERGIPYNVSVTFATGNLPAYFNGTSYWFDVSYHVQYISNLPSGICWATNDSMNVGENGDLFCLNFSGTTNAPAGAYKVERMIYTVFEGVPMIPEQYPTYFYLRVVEPGAPCQASVIYNDVSETETALPELKLAGEKLLVSNIQPGAVVSIYDLAGRLLKEQTTQQAAEINVSEIHGMFLVNVSYRGNRYTQKFVR